jgi:hypothetical protein
MKYNLRQSFSTKLFTKKTTKRQRIRMSSGPLAKQTLFMAAPSGTLDFSIHINGRIWTGHYTQAGTWAGEYKEI